jgi:hypothetical protein
MTQSTRTSTGATSARRCGTHIAAGRKASTADAALAFGAYTAALDREESAAKVYAELMRRVDDLERTWPATDSECRIDTEAATGPPLPLPIAPSLEQKSKRRP